MIAGKLRKIFNTFASLLPKTFFTQFGTPNLDNVSWFGDFICKKIKNVFIKI